MTESRGSLIILSAPSGGGKTTLVTALRRRHPEFGYSVSATTRPPRSGEQNGIDYFFLDVSTFQRKIEENAFAEWAEVHGHLYGTLRDQIHDRLNQGESILMDVDVQGGIALKKVFQDAITIFILPVSMNVLEQRLRRRGTDDESIITQRLETARTELTFSDQYDFQVINDRIDDVVKEIEAIINGINHSIKR